MWLYYVKAESMRHSAVFASVSLLTLLAYRCSPACSPALNTELEGAVGGVCQNCTPDTTGMCTGKPTCSFDDGTGLWGLITYTGITPQSCQNAASGQLGFTACKVSGPMTCYTFSLCTEVNCNNCTVQKQPQQNTACSTSGGYQCKG